MTEQQCKSFYSDGEDGTVFFALEKNLGSRDKAEKLLVLCDYDFAVASELASLCHYNFRAVKDFVGKFGNNPKKAIEYLKWFKNAQPQNATTTHCKAALKVFLMLKKSNLLSEFKGDVAEAKDFPYFMITPLLLQAF